ncbi:hypothetical protein KHDHEBDM_00548 [Pectobacterium polaris]|nr:hypothetical protein KHDHEBDM_00548 [Pectobacterium polaris]
MLTGISKPTIPVILQVACALAALLTRITYLSKLIGIPYLAAFLKLELFRVLIGVFRKLKAIEELLQVFALLALLILAGPVIQAFLQFVLQAFTQQLIHL